MDYLIFDLVIAAVLLICAIHGAWRGLVLSLCGLLAAVVAFAGAGFAAKTLSPLLAGALEPRIAAAIELRLEEELPGAEPAQPDASAPQAPEEVPLPGVLETLRDMGLYQNLIDAVGEAVAQGMSAAAATAAASVAAALAQSVAYLGVFIVAFVLILLVWRLISGALDLVARLPVLHFLNKTGGAIFGLLQACILLFVAAWLAQYLGNWIPEETVQKTWLLQFFMRTNPVELIARLTGR